MPRTEGKTAREARQTSDVRTIAPPRVSPRVTRGPISSPTGRAAASRERTCRSFTWGSFLRQATGLDAKTRAAPPPQSSISGRRCSSCRTSSRSRACSAGSTRSASARPPQRGRRLLPGLAPAHLRPLLRHARRAGRAPDQDAERVRAADRLAGRRHLVRRRAGAARLQVVALPAARAGARRLVPLRARRAPCGSRGSTCCRWARRGKPTKPGKYIVGLPVPGAAGILISLVVANHAMGAGCACTGRGTSGSWSG